MSPSHILLIEPDSASARALAEALRGQNLRVSVAATGQEGLRLAHSLRPDLITLEVELPDVPGTEICRTLRAAPETRRTPILVLTARSDEIDRVVLFELGADDYVTRPYSLREVLLRIRARLRRSTLSTRPPVSPTAQRHGALELDLDARWVRVSGHELGITPIESRILRVLSESAGHAISRELLYSRVWGASMRPESRVIDAQVKRLRKKLGPAASCIETVRGVGYRFVASDHSLGTSHFNA